MSEPTSFEARAVIAPRRPRQARLALLVPAIALVSFAWAGWSGARSDQATAERSQAAFPARSSTAGPSEPAVVPVLAVGLHVQRLDQVDTESAALEKDVAIAVSGWYVATAITDCPPLAAIYRLGALPYFRGDTDKAAYCVRHGVLYVAEPDIRDSSSRGSGLLAVPVTIAVGVIAPLEIEQIGAAATQVVVVGQFVQSGARCELAADCARELVVDHVAWTPGA